MKHLSLKKTNRGFVWVALIALTVLIFMLLLSPAASHPSSSEFAVPAANQSATNAIEQLGIGPDRAANQPPGLIDKPQNHLAPPEETPPNFVPPSGTPPAQTPPSEPPDGIIINPVNPKPPAIPVCPMFESGADTYSYKKCGTCRQPLTAGDVYVCAEQ